MNSIWLNAVRASGVALDPDAAAIIAAMTTPPNGARRSLINDTVVALKSAGVWSLLDALWVMAAHDEQAGRLNWKAPASFTLAANGVITFTADRGWQGDGSTGYLDTGWIPATHGVNYTLNDASLGLYSRSDSVGAYLDMGSGTGTSSSRTYVGFRISGNAVVRINQGASGNGAVAVATSTGFQASRRTASNATQIIRDGAAIFSDTRASDALPIYPFFIGAENRTTVASNITDRQYPLAFTAAAMSEAQQLALYNTFQSGYLTSVGAAV